MRGYSYIIELNEPYTPCATRVLEGIMRISLKWLDRDFIKLTQKDPFRYRLTLLDYLWPRHLADSLTMIPFFRDRLRAIEDCNRRDHSTALYRNGYRYETEREP